MTHYTRDYSTLTGSAKSSAAIADIIDFLGDNKFDELTAEFRRYRHLELDQFACFVGIAGISGYPVEAWHDYIYTDSAEDEAFGPPMSITDKM